MTTPSKAPVFVQWLATAILAILILGIGFFLRRPLIYLLPFALAFGAPALLWGQLRAIADLSAAPIGRLTWVLIGAGGICAVVAASGPIWTLSDHVLAAALTTSLITWDDADGIRVLVRLPAGALFALYVGPLIILLLRDLAYRVHRWWSELRKAGASRRAQERRISAGDDTAR
jgi:hypothetical protein